jgi:hypothetical protein
LQQKNEIEKLAVGGFAKFLWLRSSWTTPNQQGKAHRRQFFSFRFFLTLQISSHGRMDPQLHQTPSKDVAVFLFEKKIKDRRIS